MQRLLPADLGDLVEVDQRFDGVALGVVVRELAAVGEAVVGEEPVVQQQPGGVRGAGLALGDPERTFSRIAGTHGAVIVRTSNRPGLAVSALGLRAMENPCEPRGLSPWFGEDHGDKPRGSL